MSAVAIRPATPADVPAITRIYAYAVKHGTASFELEPPDEAEMARRQHTLVDGGYPYLVAEQKGRVVGYAYANAYGPRPAYRFAVENSIYVAPAAMRTGAGRLLMQHLIADCSVRGYRQMIAVIGDSRQTASIQLHRAMGFTFVGTLHSVGYKFGRWLDGVLMQIALGPGDTAAPRDGA